VDVDGPELRRAEKVYFAQFDDVQNAWQMVLDLSFEPSTRLRWDRSSLSPPIAIPACL
jgi:hypothetical protein